MRREMNRIRSNTASNRINKISLSSYNDKKYT